MSFTSNKNLPEINMVGLLITKDEESIIEEVISKNEKYFDSIYALDGSTDSTPEKLSKFPKIKYLGIEKDLGIEKTTDGVRSFVLNQIKANEPIENTWITLLHSDEIFYHNPRKVAQLAQLENAECVFWYAMHFFLHKSDEAVWDDIKNLPVEQRVTHYATNERPWTEFRQFKLKENLVYHTNTHHIIPDGTNIYNKFSKFPIYKHFLTYDLDNHSRLTLSRTKKRGGNLEDKFIDRLDDGCGNYKFVHKFDGSFGFFEYGKELLK